MTFLSEDKRLLTYGIFEPHKEITCFTTTRHGGCSNGNYSSFNCGPFTTDNPDCVKQNLETLKTALANKPQRFVIPKQIHGDDIAVIDDDFLSATDERQASLLDGVDIVMTDKKGICVCISTADCIPLAFYDTRNKAVCVAHAGWRGTVKRIAKTAIKAMDDTFGTQPCDIIAVIGPGISLAGFEVGDEVHDEFVNAGFAAGTISERQPKSRKYHINLWIANRMTIEEAGVPSSQIELAAICTYLRYGDFFSARRLGTQSGRMLTGIMLNED